MTNWEKRGSCLPGVAMRLFRAAEDAFAPSRGTVQVTHVDVYTVGEDGAEGDTYRLFRNNAVDVLHPEETLHAAEGSSGDLPKMGVAAQAAAEGLLLKMADELRNAGSAYLAQAHTGTALARSARQFVGLHAIEVAGILQRLAAGM